MKRSTNSQQYKYEGKHVHFISSFDKLHVDKSQFEAQTYDMFHYKFTIRFLVKVGLNLHCQCQRKKASILLF